MLLVVENWKSAAFADQSKYFEPETSSGLSELRERKPYYVHIPFSIMGIVLPTER